MKRKIGKGYVTIGEDDNEMFDLMVSTFKKIGWKASWDQSGDYFIVAPKDEFKAIDKQIQRERKSENEED